MGQVTRTYTYTAGNTITAAQNETNETDLYNEFNGNIDNDNIKSAAAIVESKIAFNTSTGHSHDGTDSKAIPKGMVFTVTGSLTTGTSVSPLLISTGTLTITKVYVNVKTAPTGASLIIDINKNGTSIWNATQANRATITSGNTSGSQTSFDTVALAEGDVITLDIDQIGSTVSGADLTVTIKA